MHHSPPQMLNSYLIKGERPSLSSRLFYEPIPLIYVFRGNLKSANFKDFKFHRFLLEPKPSMFKEIEVNQVTAL